MLTVLRRSQPNWTSELKVATGRSAVAYLITKASPKAVLMPAYVPEGIINPFQQAGVPIKFYKLQADLRPDLDHLSKMMVKGALAVIIHYFGFYTESGAIREIVSDAGGIYFEDCAHDLFNEAPRADVALWSLNKFLPVVDGAILRSRRRDINVESTVLRPPLPASAIAAYHEHLDLNSKLAAKIYPSHAMDLISASNGAYERYYKEMSADLSLHSQSHESKVMAASTDMARVKEARRHNCYSYYRSIPDCFHFRKTSAEAPFAFPIVVRPPLNCEEVWNRLLDFGIVADRLIEKWDHIPRGDARFLIEHTFMDEHLLLPVDENVSYDEVRKIAKCLEEIAGE